MPYLVAGDQESYVISTKDKVIGRAIFLEGSYDLHKLLLAVSILEKRGYALKHIVDVGSNIGSIVIPAVRRNIFERGTAIEPHPENFKLLCANLALNGISSRVTTLSNAVGTESGSTLRMLESVSNSGNHMISDDGLQVATIRLDELGIGQDGTLLWMDIEGYEGHALAGAPELVSAGVPLVAEYNPGFLRLHDGLEMLESILCKHEIFDIGMGGMPTSFKTMRERYEDSATDFLALRP
ncbi:MAG TPA: FkbM family methyltransferase [Pseudoxanthomonas sp.]